MKNKPLKLLLGLAIVACASVAVNFVMNPASAYAITPKGCVEALTEAFGSVENIENRVRDQTLKLTARLLGGGITAADLTIDGYHDTVITDNRYLGNNGSVCWDAFGEGEFIEGEFYSNYAKGKYYQYSGTDVGTSVPVAKILYAATGEETGYGFKERCWNLVKHKITPKSHAWEIKTGSYGQATNNSDPTDSKWAVNSKAKITQINRLYFTHNAGIARTGGNTLKNPNIAGSGAASDIKVKYTTTFEHDNNRDGLAEGALNGAQVVSFFGADAGTKCEAEVANYWGGGAGWNLEDAYGNAITSDQITASLLNFKKDAIVHWGLGKSANSETQKYLCEIRLTDAMKQAIWDFSNMGGGEDIILTSTIEITPGGMKTNQVKQPSRATSSAKIIIEADPSGWEVSIMSYASVRNPVNADIVGCTANTYCPGAVGIGSGNATYPGGNVDAHAIKVTQAAEGSDVNFGVNFRHSVTVQGDNATGTAGKAQLWFYKIVNFSGYRGDSSVFYSNGCLGTYNSGSTDSMGGLRPVSQWYPIVLETGKTYDILTGTGYTGDQVAFAANSAPQALCANNLTHNPQLDSGGFRSRLYLCFASADGYKYKYGDAASDLNDDLAAARSACENGIGAITQESDRNETAASSNAVVLYKKEKENPCKDPAYAALHPDECGGGEIELSKTQTCAVNGTLGQSACDPRDTEPDDGGFDEFQAITTEEASGDPHGVPTQLARPGDEIYFDHYFEKNAQILAEETEWVALPDFSASKCSGEGSFYYGGTMNLGNSDDCQKVSGPEQKMEEKIAHSHSGATDMTGTGGASGNKVLDVADSCFYTGKNNETNISVHNVKSDVPVIGTLRNIPSCSNNAYLKNTFTGKSLTVLSADVGSKEIYQKATLFDRAAQKLVNCREGDCKDDYPRAGQKEGATDIQTNTGEDNEHKYTVKWKIWNQVSNGSPSEYPCDGSCDGSCYGGGCNNGCGCGTAAEGSYNGSGSYIEYEHVWVKMVDHGPVSSNAQFNIPYNYDLQPVISPTELPSGMITGGNEWDYDTWINVLEKSNEEFGGETYATVTRPGTEWKITEFYIGENITSDPNPATQTINDAEVAWKNGSGDTCSVYKNAGNGYGGQIQNISDNCLVVDSGIGPLNTDNGQRAVGITNGSGNTDAAYRSHTAIIADAPAGTKFCIGLSVMDYTSTEGSEDDSYGDGVRGWWIHLKPKCVSIAKVPSMQIWGGGLYSDGIPSGSLPGSPAKDAVIGKYVPKTPALPYWDDGSGRQWKAFGSWSEYEAIGSIRNSGNATIKLFGSAAALGRGLDIGDNISGVGSGGSITNGCAFAKLHVANTTASFTDDSLCHTPESAATGNSTVFKGLAERIALRYTGRVQGNEWVTGPTVKVDSVTNSGIIDNGTWSGGSIAPKTGEVTYYHNSNNVNISATNISKGKTVIVEINGKATITGDITYTDETLSSIYDIPQVIIFANNIDIAPEVTQIDAWLMVGLKGSATDGVINTCAINGITEDTLIASNGGDTFSTTDGSPPSSDSGNQSEQCRNRLKINGPVQAKKLRLLRSYGAGMGLDCNYDYTDGISYDNNNQAQWPNGGKTANCGAKWYGTGEFPYDSATPAEVFNLRADAYLWAFRQVENYSQAFVTFQREVAPRW